MITWVMPYVDGNGGRMVQGRDERGNWIYEEWPRTWYVTDHQFQLGPPVTTGIVRPA